MTVDINEKVLQDLMPELDNTAAIRLWVQQLVNYHTKMMVEDNNDAVDMKFSRDMTPEELYRVIEQDVRAIYADESI